MLGILPSKPFESGDKSRHSKKDGSLELVFQQPTSVVFLKLVLWVATLFGPCLLMYSL